MLPSCLSMVDYRTLTGRKRHKRSNAVFFQRKMLKLNYIIRKRYRNGGLECQEFILKQTYFCRSRRKKNWMIVSQKKDQMNPHFMLNILNAVSGLAYIEDAEQTGEMGTRVLLRIPQAVERVRYYV